MEQGPEDFSDARIKHLEMLQGVIQRMANSSAGVKRMTMLVVGGAVAVTAKAPLASAALSSATGSPALSDAEIPLLGILLVILFWALDARYHQQERWFRRIFEEVRAEPTTQRPDFRINPANHIRTQCGFGASMFTWSTWPFYIALIAFLVLLWGIQ